MYRPQVRNRTRIPKDEALVSNRRFQGEQLWEIFFTFVGTLAIFEDLSDIFHLKGSF